MFLWLEAGLAGMGFGGREAVYFMRSLALLRLGDRKLFFWKT
jgi:hypothetical protein